MKRIITAALLVTLCVSAFAELDKSEMFGSKVYRQDKKPENVSDLKADIYGIYFSAHWCPPCRAFTPKLVEAYNEIRKSGGKFEILFVSSDRSKSAMFEYMEETDMPWLAVKHHGKEAEALSRKYGVRGIPTLVIIDAEGNLITKDGRDDVHRKGADAFAKWKTAAK